MAGMKVSLDGLLKNAARNKAYRYMLLELRDNLRELRDHPEKHGEFFDLYVIEPQRESEGGA